MSETQTTYYLSQEDDDIKIIIINRSCMCTSPGCVDDELQIFADGEDETPYRLQVPRIMMDYLQDLFDNEATIQKVDHVTTKNSNS